MPGCIVSSDKLTVHERQAMRKITRRDLCCGAAASALTPTSAILKPRPATDVNLILAIDVSDSIKVARWDVQKKGYAAAFANPEIQDAILQGSIGSIGVVVVQWSSRMNQTQIVPWMLIDSREKAGLFSILLANMPRMFQENTGIGAAMEYCATALHFAPYEARRSVIDISGDGVDNDPPQRGEVRVPLMLIRHEVTTRFPRLTINGLALRGADDTKDVDLLQYFEDQVICGPSSFAIAVDDPSHLDTFTRGLEKKLFKEIVG